MARARKIFQTVTFTKEHGKMIQEMDMVFSIFIPLIYNTKESGRMDLNRAMGQNISQAALNMEG
jgi:hypothetical protein